jgi:hypothetical protein
VTRKSAGRWAAMRRGLRRQVREAASDPRSFQQWANMSDIDVFLDARERLFKRTVLSSGISLLLAAASRLPTWEVAAPVDWLLGTLNVGFVPVFGPIVIFGSYCFAMVALGEVTAVQKALSLAPALTNVERAVLAHSGVGPAPDGGRQRIANYALRSWIFLVPLVAYIILLVTYLDFVRPSVDDPHTPMFHTHGERVTDILIGTGGWGSFRPITPSISDNLKKRAEAAEKIEEKERLKRIAALLPYIHAPLQAWGYLLGLALMIYMAGEELLGRFWRQGAALAQKLRSPRIAHQESASHDDARPDTVSSDN